jgi:hypothetical protein
MTMSFLFSRYIPGFSCSLPQSAGVFIGVLTFIFSLVPTAAPAQSAACAGQAEMELRERALASNDPELTRRYLTCFAYGDGANSVRAQDKKLQEATACQKAMTSNNPDELRAFVSQWSQSECAPRIALRLSQLNDVSSYTRYPNSLFTGVISKQGTIESERACALTCKATGSTCPGFSFEDSSNVCTLWSRIDSRMPRGATVSGSTTPVELGMPAAQQPPPIQPPPAAAPIPGAMRYIQGMDIPDGDYFNLRDISIEQCDAVCKQQSACVGFTFNTRANACFLKNQLSAPVPFANAVSGFKASANPMNAPPRPVQILDNTDLPNSNPADDYALLRQTTYNACRASCEGDRQCAAFTYNHSAQACILKRAYGRRLMFDGATSGIK